MKIAASSNIYETFSPLYKVLKLLGIISFELDVHNGKVSLNRFDLVWMLVLWVFWTCLIIGNLYLGARDPTEHSKIILTGWHWLLIFQLAACFYIQLVSLARRKSIGKLFQILNQIDGMVRRLLRSVQFNFIAFCRFQNASLHYREDHTAVKSWTINTIAGSQLINFLVSAFIIFVLAAHYPNLYEPEYILYASSLFVTLSHFATFHQFIFVISSIKSRFKILNENMKWVYLCSFESKSCQLLKIAKLIKYQVKASGSLWVGTWFNWRNKKFSKQRNIFHRKWQAILLSELSIKLLFESNFNRKNFLCQIKDTSVSQGLLSNVRNFSSN